MIARLVREPALLLGVVTTAFGLAALLGLPISEQQIAGVVAFVGALVALLRFLTVPAAEVVVQEKPDGQLVAGPASVVPTGAVLEQVDASPAGYDVTLYQRPDGDLKAASGPGPKGDQRGTVPRDLLLGACIAGVILLVLLVLL